MFKEIKQELVKLKIENDLLKDLLDKTFEKDYQNKICIGSRVQILYDDGKTQDGRVVRQSSDRKIWYINRDGYAGTIGMPPDRLKLIYPGIEGLIEIKNWFNLIRLQEIDAILMNSDLPVYFSDKEYVNIKVVAKSERSYGYCIVDCQIFNYTPVQRIKIPDVLDRMGKYLQLRIVDGEIAEIHPISKERYQNEE